MIGRLGGLSSAIKTSSRTLGRSRRFTHPRVSFNVPRSTQLPTNTDKYARLFTTSQKAHTMIKKIPTGSRCKNRRWGERAWTKVSSVSLSNPFNNLALLFTNLSGEGNEFQSRIPEKNLYSVGGHEEALDSLADLVRYLQDPKAFTKLGANAPKGVILSGPSGVGKSFLAEAVAGHAGVPLFLVSGAEFGMPLVGQSEGKLRELFEQAEKEVPCVICIDEIDSIGMKRSCSEYTLYRDNMVNQLLTLLSQDHPGIIVIGTTNYFEKLDPALVRPGRFDKHIVLSLPNLAGRETILKIHTKGKKLSSGVSLKDLASISGGFSGAKLEAWVNEAVICAGRYESPEINVKHFDEARSLIQNGVLSKSNANPQQKYFTAVHEAGHALVAHLLNRELYKVSTLQHGDTLGFTEFINDDGIQGCSKQDALDSICIALAGRAAETILKKQQMGSVSDIKKAKKLAWMMVKNEAMGPTLIGRRKDVEKILRRELRRASELLKTHHKTFERIVDALVKRGELLHKDFLRVVEGIDLNKCAVQSSPKAKKISLPLPATPRKCTQTTAKASQVSDNNKASLPFTIEEVAKAIGVDPFSIRKITNYEGGYAIRFKTSFRRHKYMKFVSEELDQNHVENYYSRGLELLEIESDGVEDFIRFVKKKR